MYYFHINGESYYEKLYDNISIFENLYDSKQMKSFSLISAWGKLYKAKLFDDIRFDKGKLGEDGYINQKLYLLVQKVIYIIKVFTHIVSEVGVLQRLGQKSGCMPWLMLCLNGLHY